MNKILITTSVLLATAAFAQEKQRPAPKSPPMTASASIGGRTVSIKYSAPSVRGRQVFGEGGLVSKDRTAPMWRAGANSATTLVVEGGGIKIGNLAVPAGTYTLFVNPTDAKSWELAVNKQTGQWGLTYDAAQDLGRVKMTMSKPAAMVELLVYTIADGKITLSWENVTASVPVGAQ